MSADLPLGVPFNVAGYSLLTRMLAQVVNMLPGKFIWSGGDCHVYNDQIEPLKEMLKRTPAPQMAQLRINQDVKNIEDFVLEDFQIVGYSPQDHIHFPVSV